MTDATGMGDSLLDVPEDCLQSSGIAHVPPHWTCLCQEDGMSARKKAHKSKRLDAFKTKKGTLDA